MQAGSIHVWEPDRPINMLVTYCSSNYSYTNLPSVHTFCSALCLSILQPKYYLHEHKGCWNFSGKSLQLAKQLLNPKHKISWETSIVYMQHYLPTEESFVGFTCLTNLKISRNTATFTPRLTLCTKQWCCLEVCSHLIGKGGHCNANSNISFTAIHCCHLPLLFIITAKCGS
jgi:hypothetical protein